MPAVLFSQIISIVAYAAAYEFHCRCLEMHIEEDIQTLTRALKNWYDNIEN